MKPTEETFRNYCEKQDRKRALEREARGIDKELKDVAKQVTEHLDSIEKTEAKRGNFRALFKMSPGRPKWQDEFIARLGHDAATELKAATPEVRSLVITPL